MTSHPAPLLHNEVVQIECGYCHALPIRMTGKDLFPDRSDLVVRHYLVCRNCDAWVGCHPGTWTPYGELADPHLRQIRRQAHDAFDGIWRAAAVKAQCPEAISRSAAYAWLSGWLHKAHIAGMNIDQCTALIDACTRSSPDLLPRIRQIQAQRQSGHRK